jgi:hypothetical protein
MQNRRDQDRQKIAKPEGARQKTLKSRKDLIKHRPHGSPGPRKSLKLRLRLNAPTVVVTNYRFKNHVQSALKV